MSKHAMVVDVKTNGQTFIGRCFVAVLVMNLL